MKVNEAMQGWLQFIWDETNKSLKLKMGLRECDPVLVYVIQAMEDMI